MKTPNGHGLGWSPSLPDQRDYVYRPPDVPIRPTIDLRQQMLPVRDQGDEGSCTAFAATAMAYHTYTRDGWHNPFPPSPRFTYYAERLLMEQAPYNIANATGQDTGGFGRAVVSSLAKYGITAEKNCPYAPDGDPIDTLTVAPPTPTFANAEKHLATSYFTLAQQDAVMAACLAEGYTFIVGITVYASFESETVATTGLVPLPDPTEKILGGHELVICGRLTKNGTLYYVAQNSWGAAFGDQGYVYLPATYLTSTSLASDFWTLRTQH